MRHEATHHPSSQVMAKSGDAAGGGLSLEPESLAETFITYQRPILIGAIVLAAGALGSWLWIRSAQIREERAGAAYLQAESAFASGNKALAQTEFERLTTRFPGTNAGTQSAMLLSQLLYEQGQFAEGVTQLEGALRRAPRELRPAMHALIGAGQEGAGKPIEAAAAYARAAESTRFEAERDLYRMDRARTLAAGGDRAGAVAVYREISEKEDSPYGGEARLRMGELMALP
jgi:predicted negative regulator of RcsB-dependent stress response